jgi:heme A synthase
MIRVVLARFAWSVTAYNIAVILWGAYVRATGSGAGCGRHWPLCNGEVIPRAPALETIVEFSHRATSGIALLSVVALLVWTARTYPPGHRARRGAWWVVAFMLVEAAVGAGLVLFELVADNASMARAMFMAVHLANTFLLLAALTLTAYWLSGGARVRIRGRGGLAALVALPLAGLLAAGVSGAVAALGDTLFPAASLSTALAADLSPSSHALIRLRLLHPLIAVLGAVLVIAVAPRVPISRTLGPWRNAGRLAAVLAACQLGVGVLNVVLLAPVWMQLLHLFVADVLWLALVVFGATALAPDPALATGEEGGGQAYAIPPAATISRGPEDARLRHGAR